jgi:hypothetical protein
MAVIFPQTDRVFVALEIGDCISIPESLHGSKSP